MCSDANLFLLIIPFRYFAGQPVYNHNQKNRQYGNLIQTRTDKYTQDGCKP